MTDLESAIVKALDEINRCLRGCRESDTREIHEGFCEGFGHSTLLKIAEPLLAAVPYEFDKLTYMDDWPEEADDREPGDRLPELPR